MAFGSIYNGHPGPALDADFPARHCLIPPLLVMQAHDTVSNTRVAIKKSALFSDANDPNDQGIPVPCPLRNKHAIILKDSTTPKNQKQ